jgi:hypothetical protein
VLWWWCLGWRERTTRKEEIEKEAFKVHVGNRVNGRVK